MQLTRTHSTITKLLLIPCLAHCYHGAEIVGDFSETTSSGATAAETTTAASAGGSDATTGDADDGAGMDDDDDAVDAFIDGLGHLGLPQEQEPVPIECQGEACLDNTDLCTYSYYNTTEHFADFVAFSPNSAVLWPGAIVEGAAASEGQLNAITLPRAPLTFSLSLENLGGSPVGHMEEPSLSAFREARNEILSAGVTGATPAVIDFALTQVHTEADLSLGLKVDVDWPGGSKISGMFDFKKESSSTKILVDFTQAYYTIDIDVPAQPGDLFAPEVTVDDLVAFMGVDNPPMYVQSITFGRRAIFSVDSTHSKEEVTSALDVTIKAITSGKVEIDQHSRSVIDTLEMKVFVLGGSGESAVNAIEGFEGLVEYIQTGADYSAESPGAPIAYKMAYLDNTATKFAYTTDFAEAVCLSEVTIRVSGDSLRFIENGEGSGNGELTWGVWVESGGQKCDLSAQGGEVKIDDGQLVPINSSCDFTFKLEADPSLMLGFWATEHGDGLFDPNDKTVDASRPYAFDADTGQWSPSLGATTLNAQSSNLNVELQYSIDIL